MVEVSGLEFILNPESGWILHSARMGVSSPSPTDGLWLWKEGLGWIWTDDGIYPYFYSEDSGHWVYFLEILISRDCCLIMERING